MEKMDVFSDYHPIISMLYFVLVIGGAMIIMNPICMAISLISALTYAIYLKGKKAIKFNVIYMIPLLITTALINPAFSHQGVTILTYLPSGNPLTLESILYGVASAVLLICTITWFSSFNLVMTSDKFIYLFGRIIPALSLVLSMSLRFVPRFIEQVKVIANAQRLIGRDVQTGGIIKRAKHGIRILSILVTWALENAIDTADSMKSRGYGLKGRTAFSIYRFDKRDKRILIFLSGSGIALLGGVLSKQFKFIYYPTITEMNFTIIQICLFVVYFALCATPIILNVKEDLKWKTIAAKSLPSKI